MRIHGTIDNAIITWGGGQPAALILNKDQLDIQSMSYINATGTPQLTMSAPTVHGEIHIEWLGKKRGRAVPGLIRCRMKRALLNNRMMDMWGIHDRWPRAIEDAFDCDLDFPDELLKINWDR